MQHAHFAWLPTPRPKSPPFASKSTKAIRPFLANQWETKGGQHYNFVELTKNTPPPPFSLLQNSGIEVFFICIFSNICMPRIVYELNSWLGYRIKHMAMHNPTSSHHLKLSIMPSTSYVPTFLRTSSPTSGGPLAPRRLVLFHKIKRLILYTYFIYDNFAKLSLHNCNEFIFVKHSIISLYNCYNVNSL